MNFTLVLAGVCAVAGAATFVITGAPAGTRSPLAGDWRCNHHFSGANTATIMSVSDDGATRGQAVFNSQMEGRWVMIKGSYSGHISLDGDEVAESLAAVTIDGASVDGKIVPEGIRVKLLEEFELGSSRYALEEFTASRLVYSQQGEQSVCERSPVPLNL